MKRWHLGKYERYHDYKETKFLYHECEIKDHRSIAVQVPDGRWKCDYCGDYAPEEMGFVAELAGCIHRITITQSSFL